MAAFLRRSRTHLVSAPGKLLSWCEQPRSRGSLSAGSLLRSSEAIGGWRGSGGVPFSSWTGGAGAWRYHSYQRPRLAEWGDWACVGLTALAGGLYWTSWTPSKETLAEKLLNVVVVYEALSYSLKRKVLRLRLKWFRHKLVLKGAVLKELERKNEEHLGEVASIVQEIEDAIFHKMGKVSDKVHIDSGDPFLTSAYIMLRRIYRIREFVSRKPKGSSSGDSSVRTDFDSQRTEGFLVQLSKLEEMVGISFCYPNYLQLLKNSGSAESRARLCTIDLLRSCIGGSFVAVGCPFFVQVYFNHLNNCCICHQNNAGENDRESSCIL